MNGALGPERKVDGLVLMRRSLQGPRSGDGPSFCCCSKRVRPRPIAANLDPLSLRFPYRPIAFSIAEPRLAGDSATLMPAAFLAAILSAAPPLPPDLVAPASPMPLT